jgi:hypothetical protein
MKTTIIFGLGFLVAVLLLSSFNSIKFLERQTQICHDCVSDNFKEVPLVDFFSDVARYNGTHVKEVKPGLRSATGNKLIEPSRLCMYSLDTLKKFICFIETYSDQAKLNHKGLGINFYYAVYPKKKLLNGENYGSLHTLYMVPTYYHPSLKKAIPIDLKALANYRISNPNDEKISPLTFSLDSLFKRDPKHVAFIMNSSSFSSSTYDDDGNIILNQGQLCPPACVGTQYLFGSRTY